MPTTTARLSVTTRRSNPGGLRDLQNTVFSNTNRAAYNFARTVESGAKRRAHVITGNMRRSIVRYRLGPGQHIVIVGAYYGIYEEVGTRHRPPHPFFKPSVEEAKAKFYADMRRVFRP